MKDEIKTRLSRHLFSSFIPDKSGSADLHPSSFTLIEMLTTIAALVILLGLMVSLARDVRARSASALTAEILTKLERLMTEYQQRTGQLPDVVSILADGNSAVERSVNDLARENNRQFLTALRSIFPLTRQFGELQLATYSDSAINDAWGDPIVFMPHSDSSIGLSPDNRFFFFSAGPDRRYLTRDDNLYSYDRDNGGQSE